MGLFLSNTMRQDGIFSRVDFQSLLEIETTLKVFESTGSAGYIRDNNFSSSVCPDSGSKLSVAAGKPVQGGTHVGDVEQDTKPTFSFQKQSFTSTISKMIYGGLVRMCQKPGGRSDFDSGWENWEDGTVKLARQLRPVTSCEDFYHSVTDCSSRRRQSAEHRVLADCCSMLYESAQQELYAKTTHAVYRRSPFKPKLISGMDNIIEYVTHPKPYRSRLVKDKMVDIGG